MMQKYLTFEPYELDWETFDQEFLRNGIKDVPLIQVILYEHIEMFRVEQISGDMELLDHTVVIDIPPSIIEDYNVAY